MSHTHRKQWLAFVFGAVTILLLLVWGIIPKPARESNINTPSPYEIQLEHRRQTWMSALEWCESMGFNEAVNPKDKDGTPSWYSFQFKPETFLGLGVKYGLIATSTTEVGVMELMKDYGLTRTIVGRMIDDPSVVWRNQFPDCVKNKVGLPPVK